MSKRYFRKKDPNCKAEDTEWIEMTGREYYCFVRRPENKKRFFIDMEDIVLESNEADIRKYKAEKNHSYYIQEQEEGWSTVSIYTVQDENGCSGEEVVTDESEDVEAKAILNIEAKALRAAVARLDQESYRLIYTLYLAEQKKTLRQLSRDSGIPVMTLRDRKERVLRRLREELSKKFSQ